MNRSWINQLKDHPLVPVFYHSDVNIAKEVVLACYAGGVRHFEWTNRGPAALEIFRSLRNLIDQECPGMTLGIGTILHPEQALPFLDAGADFLVQPGTTLSVGELCAHRNIPWIPGVMTPTEIMSAWMAGATAVKIFPGQMLSPAYIKALRGPFPQIPMMVTGGVEPTEESLQSWLGSGVQAVGLGSQLFKNLDDPSTITQLLIHLHSTLPTL